MASLQNISHMRAIIYAALILGAFLGASLFLRLPDMVQTSFAEQLHKAGFASVKAEKTDIGFSGATIHNITLDPHGFDTIRRVDIELSWPLFLLTDKIESIEITGLSLSRELSEATPLLRSALLDLLEPAAYRVSLTDMTLDVSTAVGDLRFTGDISIDAPDSKGEQSLNAHIIARQYQLGFDSKWTGRLGKDGLLDVTGDIVDGRIHFGPMHITRFSGWAGAKISASTLSLQSQMDAGGAYLFDIPMQDVSLVTDISSSAHTLIFRSSMAGMNDVTMTADMTLSKDTQYFAATLSGQSLSKFLKISGQERKSMQSIPKALNANEPFSLQAHYQPDRRFVGGPLPFSLTFLLSNEEKLGGTFLIYPDNMDIRGSAEGEKPIVNALQDYFDIDPAKINGTFIRLDGDLKHLLPENTPSTNSNES